MPRYFSAIRSSLRQPLAVAVAPVLPRLRVQVLGERLGQPIGQRLDHDRVVVVVVALRSGAPARRRRARGDRERADVVGHAASRAARRSRPATGSACRRRSLPAAAACGSAPAPPAARRPCRRRCRRRRCWPARSRRRRARVSSLLVDDLRRAAPARCRTARAPPRRTAGGRGSPGSGPSAPTRRRRTSSR